MRYLHSHGADYKHAVQSAIESGFYSDPDKAKYDLARVEYLLDDPDLKGEHLFSAYYYHSVAHEQHVPVLFDGEYDKVALIEQIKIRDPAFDVASASQKLQDLDLALKGLSIIGGASNCKSAFSECMNMFEGIYVLSPSGIYQAFSDLPANRGKQWEIIDTTDHPHYKVTPAHLQRWMEKNPDKAPQINCLALADPSNPAGGVYTTDELGALVDFCRQHDMPIVMDAVYAGIETQEGLKTTPITNLYPEGSILFKSMGKVFSSPGVRIGFVYGNPEYVKRVNDQMRNAIGFFPVVADIHAAAVMEYTPETFYERNNGLYRERMALVKERVSALNEQLQGQFGHAMRVNPFVELSEPQGGYFMLLTMPFLQGTYFPYVDEVSGQQRYGRVEGSMDITRMFTIA